MISEHSGELDCSLPGVVKAGKPSVPLAGRCCFGIDWDESGALFFEEPEFLQLALVVRSSTSF